MEEVFRNVREVVSLGGLHYDKRTVRVLSPEKRLKWKEIHKLIESSMLLIERRGYLIFTLFFYLLATVISFCFFSCSLHTEYGLQLCDAIHFVSPPSTILTLHFETIIIIMYLIIINMATSVLLQSKTREKSITFLHWLEPIEKCVTHLHTRTIFVSYFEMKLGLEHCNLHCQMNGINKNFRFIIQYISYPLFIFFLFSSFDLNEVIFVVTLRCNMSCIHFCTRLSSIEIIELLPKML